MRNTIHTEVLVPVHGNDGRPFSPTAFERFEQFLLDLAGGFSRRGEVEGCWRAPDGNTMRDRSRSYVVTFDERDAEDGASRIDTYVQSNFDQLATFVELTPTRATVF